MREPCEHASMHHVCPRPVTLGTYTTQTHVAKERLQGSVLAATMCFVEYVQLVGISFTVKDALWPSVLSPATSFFSAFFGTMSSYTDEGWAGRFWGWTDVIASGSLSVERVHVHLSLLLFREHLKYSGA